MEILYTKSSNRLNHFLLESGFPLFVSIPDILFPF